MITGKNKERFDKWYSKYDENYIVLEHLQFEMQQGVLLAYYDSLGCKIYPMGSISGDWSYSIFMSYEFDCEVEEFDFNSRNEALTEAFKQADKLENEK